MSGIKALYHKNRDLCIILAVVAAYYVQHLFTFNRGINYEEFRDANAYLLSLRGYLPYRDFEWFYGPFSLMVYPAIMKIFGVSLVVLRVSYIIFASLVIPLAYFLARRIMPAFWAGISAFLGIIFFNVPYYTFNHIFAVLGELSCILMVFRFMERREEIACLLGAGLFCALVLLTKPVLSGASLFLAVSLFLFITAGNNWQGKFKYILVFSAGALLPLVIYCLYLYSQAGLKNMVLVYPPFLAKDSVTFIDQVPRINPMNMSLVLLRRLADIFPFGAFMPGASAAAVKQAAVKSFDAFIYSSYLITAVLTGLVYLKSNAGKFNPELKEKLMRDKKFLLLLVAVSVFISLENLMITHDMSKAFNIQCAFILTVYLLYFLKISWTRRRAFVNVLIFVFLFYLSFLYFFRYPVSVFHKYRSALNLPRAGGILVSRPEKELYESLADYFSANLAKTDKIVVLGYYPQISFLTGQENMFEKEEYIFVKLGGLVAMSGRKKELVPVLTSLENRIISKMESERPKVILTMSDESSRDIELLTAAMRSYMGQNYLLAKKFGPVDIFGTSGISCWLNLYKLK